ncbi:MAG: hypothetical protein M0R46_00190 [Candidatus Muirbacterium halophilum]|nr:hypothetical protein [Candidatus Muirbacterium halophilum]MCK9474311.1 hypothetical protein [Candidatus Muirbacterium halophilum]
MLKKLEIFPVCMQIIIIFLNLERIDDFVIKLCEDIIYMEGKNVVRHKLGM